MLEKYLALRSMFKSGTGGGVPSWNDLPDKPFDIVELMPKTQLVYDESGGYFMAQADFEFVAGRTYIINWNGVEYTTTAKFGRLIVPGLENLAVAVGNYALFGEENNGLPFAVGSVPYRPEVKGFVVAAPFDGSTSVTLGVKSYSFYEASDTLLLDMRWDSAAEKNQATLYATPEQILNAFTAGKKIIYLDVTPDGVVMRYVAEAVTYAMNRIAFNTYFGSPKSWQYNGDGTYVPYSD